MARSLAALLGAAALFAACAGTPPPPIVSPTGIVYEPGIPPEETRRSQTATLYMRQDRFERALELLEEGMAADSTNPIHYFLAGIANGRLGRYAEADRVFSRAQALYPAYELDVEPEREAAWGAAFNAGLESYGEGDVDRTVGVWTEALLLWDLRPEAHRNLASVLTLEGRYDEAIDVYLRGLEGLKKVPATRFLDDEEVGFRQRAAVDMELELARLLLLTERFAEAEPLLRKQLALDPESVQLRGELAAALGGLGREAEASEIYSTLLAEEGLQATQLFNFGVALFRSQDFSSAADAFERLTEMQPNSRDAWFNYANSLFAAEAWTSLAEAGGRLIELDPLSENAHLITARAELEGGDREAAQGLLETADAVPAYVDALQLSRAGAETTVRGRLTANAAETGTPLRLRFVFYGSDGDTLGTRIVRVAAPAPGDTADFEVALASRAAAYRYELLP